MQALKHARKSRHGRAVLAPPRGSLIKEVRGGAYRTHRRGTRTADGEGRRETRNTSAGKRGGAEGGGGRGISEPGQHHPERGREGEEKRRRRSRRRRSRRRGGGV